MKLPDAREAASLGAVVLFMFAVRMRSAANFVTPGGVLFMGNDAWYHWRAATWTAANWPRTLGFDPMTGFPTGTAQGQFGTPFDLILATVATIAGWGDPAQGAWAAAAVPAVMGALAAVPAYMITRRLFDRESALYAALALAALPGVFLTRGLYGFMDHHVFEVLLQGTVVYLFVSTAGATWPRDVARMAVAGVALFVYVLVWPPAVYLAVVLVGASCAWMLTERGDTLALIRRMSITGAFAAVPALLLAPLAEGSMSLTTVSELHVYLLMALIWAPFPAAALMHVLRNRGSAEAAAASSIIAAVVAAGAVLGTRVGSVVLRYANGGVTWSTIGEARAVPLEQVPAFMLSEYGLVIVAAAAALLVMDRHRFDHMIVASWFASTLVLAVMQVRSNYYLALVVAVMAGPAVAVGARQLVDAAEPSRPGAARALVAVLIILVASAPAAGSITAEREPGDIARWEGTLDWMEEETPDPGIGYTAEYGPARDYDYSNGSYGVLSWWDYGHWITVEARRPAVANPFQQNVVPAAEFFTATNESAAGDALASLNGTAGEEVRYVVVDDRMATDKLWAIAKIAGVDDSAYYDGATFSGAYHDTMVATLYFHDGSGTSHYRLVHESRSRAVVAGVAAGDDVITTPERLSGAELRAVRASDDLGLVRPKNMSTVKVFERVEGAVVTGEADGRVSVALELRTAGGRRFTYTNTAERTDDGFVVRVPYPTHVSLGGGSSVQAIGPYRLIVDGEQVATFEVNVTAVQEGGTVEVGS